MLGGLSQILNSRSIIKKVSAMTPVDNLFAQDYLRDKVRWEQVKVFQIYPKNYDIDSLLCDEPQNVQYRQSDFRILKFNELCIS